jgi:hypothetical protein
VVVKHWVVVVVVVVVAERIVFHKVKEISTIFFCI